MVVQLIQSPPYTHNLHGTVHLNIDCLWWHWLRIRGVHDFGRFMVKEMQISLVFDIGHEPWIVCHLTKRWFLQKTKVRQTMWKRQKFRIVRLRPCSVQVCQIFDKVGFLQCALVRQVLNVIRIGQALNEFQFDFEPQGFLRGGFGGGRRCCEGSLAHGGRHSFSFWHWQLCRVQPCCST